MKHPLQVEFKVQSLVTSVWPVTPWHHQSPCKKNQSQLLCPSLTAVWTLKVAVRNGTEDRRWKTNSRRGCLTLPGSSSPHQSSPKWLGGNTHQELSARSFAGLLWSPFESCAGARQSHAGGEGSQDGAREGCSTGVVTAGGYDGESRSKEQGTWTFVGFEQS